MLLIPTILSRSHCVSLDMEANSFSSCRLSCFVHLLRTRESSWQRLSLRVRARDRTLDHSLLCEMAELNGTNAWANSSSDKFVHVRCHLFTSRGRSDHIHGIVDVLLSKMLLTHNPVHSALSNALLECNVTKVFHNRRIRRITALLLKKCSSHFNIFHTLLLDPRVEKRTQSIDLWSRKLHSCNSSVGCHEIGKKPLNGETQFNSITGAGVAHSVTVAGAEQASAGRDFGHRCRCSKCVNRCRHHVLGHWCRCCTGISRHVFDHKRRRCIGHVRSKCRVLNHWDWIIACHNRCWSHEFGHWSKCIDVIGDSK